MTGKHAVTLECSASAVTDCSGRTSEGSRSIQLGSIQQSAGDKESIYPKSASLVFLLVQEPKMARESQRKINTPPEVT